MFAIENFISYEVVQKIGWVLLHFIWQAAAIAMVMAVLLRIMRRFSANLRYIVACLTLLIIVAFPFITMQFIEVSTPPAAVKTIPDTIEPAITHNEVSFETPSAEPAKVVYVQSEPEVSEHRINWQEQVVTFLEPKLPHIVTIWLFGVFALSIWHLGGYTQLQKLRRKMVKQVDSSLNNKLKILAQKLGVKQAVQLLESALVQIPTVVGWLKPVILLPASALSGLSPEQFEAILAHELAHIKRYDYLVNILQTIVEILGFYHPAVWWISHKIRIERENCCDDLAVAICGDRISYAKALTSMEEIRGRDQLAIAATGGNLFSRIRRLLTKDSSEKTALSWIPALTVILFLIALAIPTTIAFTSSRNEENSDIQAENTDSDTKVLIEAQVIQADDMFLNQVGLLNDPNYMKYSNTLTFNSVDDSSNPFMFTLDSINKKALLESIDKSENASYTSHLFMMSTSGQEVTIKSGTSYKLKSKELGRFLKIKPQISQDDMNINISCEVITRQLKQFDLYNKNIDQNNIPESEIVEYKVNTKNSLLSDGQTLLIVGGKLVSLIDVEDGEPILSNIPFIGKFSNETTEGIAEDNEIILIKATIVPAELNDNSNFLSDNVFTSRVFRVDFNLNLLEPGQYFEIKNHGKREIILKQVPCKSGKEFPCYDGNIDFDISSNFDFNFATKRYTNSFILKHDSWDAHFTDPNTIIGNSNFTKKTLNISAWNANVYGAPPNQNVTFDNQVEVQIKPVKPENISGLQWGQDVNGLRASVEFIPDKESYSLGERIGIRFNIQNVSNKEIQIAYSELLDSLAEITNSRGDDVSIPSPYGVATGFSRTNRVNLKPKEIISLNNFGLGFGRQDDPALVKELTIDPNDFTTREYNKLEPGQYSIQYNVLLPDVTIKSIYEENNVPQPDDWKGTLQTQVKKINLTEKPSADPKRFELVLEKQSMRQAVHQLTQKYKARICFEEIENTAALNPNQYLLTGDFFAPTLSEFLNELTDNGLYDWDKINDTYVVYPKTGSILKYPVKQINLSFSSLGDPLKEIIRQAPEGMKFDFKIDPDISLPRYISYSLNIAEYDAMYALCRTLESTNKCIVWTLTHNIGNHLITLDYMPPTSLSNPDEIEIVAENENSLNKNALQWGQTVEGVQVRLQADKTTWKAGEVPKLKLDAKNNGNRELLIYRTDMLCELSVDSQLYQQKEVHAKSSPFGPGKQYDGIDITLDKRWYKNGGDELLQLSPGKHTIQVTFILHDSRNGVIEPDLAPVIAKSNPVEIEILPNDENQTDDKMVKRVISAQNMKQLALAVFMYANDHDDKLPETLDVLKPYFKDEQVFQWNLENVKYIGEGALSRPNAANIPIAFDYKLQDSDSTNFLFLDGHVAFQQIENYREFLVSKKQVLIEMKLFEVTEKFLKDEKNQKELLKNAGNPVVVSGISPDTNSPLMNMNFGPLITLLDDSQIDSLFNSNSDDSKLIAAPKVLVRNNQNATIKTVTEHPYISGYKEPNNPGENATPIIEFINVGFICTCTPHVDDNQNIVLESKLEYSQLVDDNKVTRRAMNTNIRIPRGETFVVMFDKVRSGEQTQSDSSEEKKALLVLMKTSIIQPEQIDNQNPIDNSNGTDITSTPANELIINTSEETQPVTVSKKQVLIKMNYLEVAENFLEKTNLKEAGINVNSNIGTMAIIDDSQKELFLKAVKADAKSRITNIPEMTVLNEETAKPVIKQTLVGTTCELTPTITEKQEILMRISFRIGEMVGHGVNSSNEEVSLKVWKIQFASTEYIPNGKTWAVNVGEIVPDDNKSGQPEEKKRIIVFVQPTIIQPEQQKTKDSTHNDNGTDMIGAPANEFIINTSEKTQPVKEQQKPEKVTDSNMVQRTYDIADLVYYSARKNSDANNTKYSDNMTPGMGGGMMGGMGSYYGNIPNQAITDGTKELLNQIMESVEPNSWYEKNNKAKGTIYPYPANSPKKIAVTNAPEVHTQIENFLESLRKSIDQTQVSLELRYLYASEQSLNEILKSTGIEKIDKVFLDDTQVASLIKATQGKSIKSLTAPRVTVLNGETALFTNMGQQSVSLDQVDSLCKITPRVSQDKNNITIDFNSRMALEQNNSNQLPKVDEISLTDITIPNRQTFVFSKVVNNLPASSGDKQLLIVLVKPTIILQEEAEALGEGGMGGSITINSEAAPRRISGQSLNSQPQENTGQVRIETQYLQVSNEFLKLVGLDANSLKTSDTWSKYHVKDSSDPNIFIIDQLSAELFQKTIESRKDVKVISRPAIFAAAGKDAIIKVLKEDYYITGSGTKSDFSIEDLFDKDKKEKIETLKKNGELIKLTGGTSFNMKPEILSDNNIQLELKINIGDVIAPEEELIINDVTVSDGIPAKNSKYTLPKEITLINKSVNTLIPSGKTLLIIGNKITEGVRRESKTPILGDLPILNRVFINRSYIKGEYIQLFLIKPTSPPPDIDEIPPVNAPNFISQADPNDPLIRKLDKKFNEHGMEK